MAEIKVEKDSGGGWKWLLAALVVAGILAALVFSTMDRGDREAADRAAPGAATTAQGGLYNPNSPVAAVTYEGERWVVRGQAVDYPESQMTRVGQSPEGYDLYANTEQGYEQGAGGGGGEITPGTEPMAYGRVYLKTTDGRYVPLFKESGLPE